MRFENAYDYNFRIRKCGMTETFAQNQQMTFCQNVYSNFRELCIYVGRYGLMKNTRRE
jgi:hypothetical protein